MTCPVLACNIQPAAPFPCTAKTEPSEAVAVSVKVVCQALEIMKQLFTAADCYLPSTSFQEGSCHSNV